MDMTSMIIQSPVLAIASQLETLQSVWTGQTKARATRP